MNGKLNSYLADIDKQATEMMFRLVEQMADKEGGLNSLKQKTLFCGLEKWTKYKQGQEKSYKQNWFLYKALKR